MARAPIIISNGGVIGELAKGINDPDVVQKIKDNVKRINDQGMAELMIIIKGKKNDPCTYWRLKDEYVYDTKFKLEIAEDLEKKDAKEFR